jgi:uncharacterized membrane protein YbhN (UPF0104 family)
MQSFCVERPRCRPVAPHGRCQYNPLTMKSSTVGESSRATRAPGSTRQSDWRWLRRAIALLLTLAVFAWIAKPIVLRWDAVREQVRMTSPIRVLIASVMFSLFLFAFRASLWRGILIVLGQRIPVAPATRIWSTSELSRYLPGVIWQVVSRIYLCRPYGIAGSVCSTSQVLELSIFTLANLLLAIGCLMWLGWKTFHGAALAWLTGALILAPALLCLVHPRVFFPITNAVLKRAGKPTLGRPMRFHTLAGMLIWNILGLVWQSLAIWLIVSVPLQLQFTKWWVVAGAYSLAWCAGFLAFWAPGGLGVREIVFVAAMDAAMPPAVRHHFADPAVRVGFLAFLSVLLRIWATLGELILAGVAFIADYRGAMDRPDAPGRCSLSPETAA